MSLALVADEDEDDEENVIEDDDDKYKTAYEIIMQSLEVVEELPTTQETFAAPLVGHMKEIGATRKLTTLIKREGIEESDKANAINMLAERMVQACTENEE